MLCEIAAWYSTPVHVLYQYPLRRLFVMADAMTRQAAARELADIQAYCLAQTGDKKALDALHERAYGRDAMTREKKAREKAIQDVRLALKLWRL